MSNKIPGPPANLRKPPIPPPPPPLDSNAPDEENTSTGSIHTNGSTQKGSLPSGWTIDKIINQFTTGNLTVDELNNLLAKSGISSNVSTFEDLTTVTFKYDKKQYRISCNTEAAKSSTDDITMNTFSRDELKNSYGLSNDIIDEFFDIVAAEGINIQKYAFKGSTGFQSIQDLVEAFRNDLILDNFLGDAIKEARSLSAIGGSEIDSVKDLNQYSEQIQLATGVEAEQLRQQAFDKFVQDFSTGNLSVKVVPQILNAIGVQYEITQNGEHTTVSFEYNNKSFKIACNTAAAEFSNDHIVQYNVQLKDLFTVTDLANCSRDDVEAYIKENYACTIIDGKVVSFAYEEYAQSVNGDDNGLGYVNISGAEKNKNTDNESMKKLVKTLVNKYAKNKAIVKNLSDNIIKSAEYKAFIDKINAEKTLSVNGVMDDNVYQGHQGDCWLVASMISLNSTELGKNVIKQSIHYNSDGSAEVYFAGVNMVYHVTREEINSEYSAGDNDLKVMEAAVRKLRNDIYSGKVKVNSTDTFHEASKSKGLEGGQHSQLWFYLTGVETEEFKTKSQRAQAQNAIQEYLNKGGVFGVGIVRESSCKAIVETDDGIYNGEFYYEGGSHAFAVVGATDDTVTIVNPWDSSIKYTITWDDLFSLNGLNEIFYLPLTAENCWATMNDADYQSEQKNVEIYLQLVGYDNASYEDYLQYTENDEYAVENFIYSGRLYQFDYDEDIQNLYNATKSFATPPCSFENFVDYYNRNYSKMGLSIQNLKTIFMISVGQEAKSYAKSVASNYKSKGDLKGFISAMKSLYPDIFTDEELIQIYNEAKVTSSGTGTNYPPEQNGDNSSNSNGTKPPIPNRPPLPPRPLRA